MADFTPRQLDALEDALEGLALGSDPELEMAGLELEPELAERLAEYQQVLALTRDAFPLDEVPEGLLDDVLAEAREVARSTPAPTPEPRESWRSTWERWRSSLIPIASLAGAAALVLWLAKPGAEHDELARVDDAATHQPTREHESSMPSDAAPREADSAEPAAGASEAMPVEPPTQPATPDTSLGQAKPTAATKSKSTSGSTAGAGAGAAKPSVAPEPTAGVEPPEPLDKDDAWTELERADAARHKGDCDRARKLYAGILAASSQSTVIGRAKAGIGLCLEQDGKQSQADTWFDDARSSNPSIDAWIRSQRDEQPMPGEKKKAKLEDNAFEPISDAL